MSNEQQAVVVAQEDREAAAKLYEWFPALSSSRDAGLKTAQFVRDGGADGWNTVLHFSRHRLASLPCKSGEGVGASVEWSDRKFADRVKAATTANATQTREAEGVEMRWQEAVDFALIPRAPLDLTATLSGIVEKHVPLGVSLNERMREACVEDIVDDIAALSAGSAGQ